MNSIFLFYFFTPGLYIQDGCKTPNISFKLSFKPAEVLRKFYEIKPPLPLPSPLASSPSPKYINTPFTIFTLHVPVKRIKFNFQIFKTDFSETVEMRENISI